jgi:hypothetical protein
MRPTEYGVFMNALDNLNELEFAASIASDAASVARCNAVLAPFIRREATNVVTTANAQVKHSPRNFRKENVPIDDLGRSKTIGSRKNARAEVWMAFTPALKDTLGDHGIRVRLDAAQCAAAQSAQQAAAEAKKTADAGARSLAPGWRALDQKELREAAREDYRRRHGFYPQENPTRLTPPRPTSPYLDTISIPLAQIYEAYRKPENSQLRELWNTIYHLRLDETKTEEEKRAEERRIVVMYNNQVPWPSLYNEHAAIQERVEKFNKRAEEILAIQKRQRREGKNAIEQPKEVVHELEEMAIEKEMEEPVVEASEGEIPSESLSSSSVEPSTSSSNIASVSTSNASSSSSLFSPTPLSPLSESNSNHPSTSVPKDGTVHIPIANKIPSNPDPVLGMILINDVPMHRFFRFPRDRETVMRPFRLTGMIGAFNVFGLVKDGGTSGQAGAMQLAIARGLVAHNPLLKEVLDKGKVFLPSFLSFARDQIRPLGEWSRENILC